MRFLAALLVGLAFAAEDEAEEEDVPPTLYVMDIILVIGLSMLFEAGREKLEETLIERGKTDIIAMIECVFKEITVLGFIGLFVFCITKSGALAEVSRPLTGQAGEEAEDAVKEAFEGIHMIIFLVMLVFITQAVILVGESSKQSAKWHKWEHCRVRGADPENPPIETQLKKEGFLTEDGRMAKPVTFTTNPFTRFFESGGVRELIQWRAIRHTFLWPDMSADDESCATIHKVKNPSSFIFEEYLTKRCFETFEDVIEVDKTTWAITLCFTPVLPFLLAMDDEQRIVVQCVLGWSLVGFMFVFGLEVYRLYIEVTPVIPEDPVKILQLMKGTSAVAATLNSRSSATPASPKAPDLRGPVDVQPLSSAFDKQDLSEPLLKDSDGDEDEAPVADTVLMERKETFKARFRMESSDYQQNTLGTMLFKLKPARNPQLAMFPFADKGPEIMTHVLEICCLWQAVAVAGLIVTIGYKDKPWGLFSTVAYCVAWGAPFYQWFKLLPKIVTKLAIVTSVEYLKDPHVIAEISAEVKRKRVRDTLKLLRIIKLEGRAARLGKNGGKLEPEKYEECLKKFSHLPPKKQREMDQVFKVFDTDNSGEINREEMMEVLASMGIVSNAAQDSVNRLISLVDRDGQGEIDKDEFKVLMMLSIEKPTKDEEEEDIKGFFEKFDEDKSGHVSIAEMVMMFAQLGCPMTEAEVREMVYETFRKPIEELDEPEFAEWLKHTESLHAGEED